MLVNIHAVVLVLMALCRPLSGARRYYYQTLSVDNGRDVGDWGVTDMCPEGSYAEGFKIQVDREQGKGEEDDNTALNSIKLFCYKDGDARGTVTSSLGFWGDWMSDELRCPQSQALVAFSLKLYELEPRDNTGAINIRFRCSDGEGLIRLGGPFWGPRGKWGDWSRACSGGGKICGIKTRVKGKKSGHRPHDESALNDVRFVCCR